MRAALAKLYNGFNLCMQSLIGVIFFQEYLIILGSHNSRYFSLILRLILNLKNYTKICYIITFI